MHLLNYISPECRTIQVSVNGMMMLSTQYRSIDLESYDTIDDSSNWN